MAFDFATQACLSSDSWVQVVIKRLKGLEVPLTLHGYIIQSIVQCPVRLFRSGVAVHNLFRIFFTQLTFTSCAVLVLCLQITLGQTLRKWSAPR